MIINSVDLKKLAVRISQYPDDGKPEFLLVGRSNVGKSSFINTIFGRKNLAYTSSKPGKTQTLNFYGINNEFYVIDAPGYGYAAVDKKTQSKFGMMIEEYLEKRMELKELDSNNTRLLSVEEIKQKLLTLEYIQERLINNH